MTKPPKRYELNEKDIDTVLNIMRKSNPDASPEMAIEFLEINITAIHQLGHTDPEKLEKIYKELQKNKKSGSNEEKTD